MAERPMLEAVLFDAGGTLVRLDFEWMSEMLGTLGLRVTPEQMAHIFSGHPAQVQDWYTRTTPKFETAAPQHRWLNEAVFVGDLLPPTENPWAVSIEVYEVL